MLLNIDNAQDSPPQWRNIQPKMSIVMRFRNPDTFLAEQGDKFGNSKDCRSCIAQINRPESFIYSHPLAQEPRITDLLLITDVQLCTD